MEKKNRELYNLLNSSGVLTILGNAVRICTRRAGRHKVGGYNSKQCKNSIESSELETRSAEWRRLLKMTCLGNELMRQIVIIIIFMFPFPRHLTVTAHNPDPSQKYS